ncbi:MAG: ABC transporter ATP-binding protein [Epsilonproteobacteria bacterium]|nr:ABC transporter ATP-binding protein [Campylobacterota bacterium]NPA56927.1 ABC transporter ATP-binding protein [Campylobacterota bacterium]
MIELVGVTKIYNYGTVREVHALKEVNLRIDRGETLLLMGPSGSGKSTLLSLIGGLTRPTFGRVVVDGEDISKLKEHFLADFRRTHIGFIFQRFNLLEELSVLDNVMLPLIVESVEWREMEARGRELLESLGLGSKVDQRVSRLSGGERQRVAIARALINRPTIIVADEPTANLDAALSRQFMEWLKGMKGEGKTIVIATHDPRFLELESVDRIVEVREGHVYDA